MKRFFLGGFCSRGLKVRGQHPGAIWCFGLWVLAVLAMGGRCLAQEETKALPLNSLSLDVEALHTLHQLALSKAQLERLQQLAVGAAVKDQKRKAGKGSKEFREKLTAMRKALLEGKDGDKIIKLGSELDALREKENPVLDDHVDMTDVSRKRALDAVRLLKPGQLAIYIGQIAEEISNPVDNLIRALDEVRSVTEEERKEQRDEIADDVSRLAVGLDPAKSKQMSEQIAALLQKSRTLSKAEYPKQQAELKKAARKLLGDLSALEVVRHQVEIDLATLLANPRLPQLLAARLGPAPGPKQK